MIEILKLLLELIRAILGGIVDLIGMLAPPAELVQLVGLLPGWISQFGGLSEWVPVDVLLLCIGATMGAWGAAFALRIVRIVASFMTGGGGA